MLFVFRHYQKSLYAVVGVLLLISFLLTNFLRVGEQPFATKEKGKPVGTLLNGASYTDLELKAVATLINAEGDEPIVRGLVSSFLLQGGIFERVYATYKNEFSGAFEEGKKRAARARSTLDPYAAEMSIEAIYAKLAPEITAVVQQLRQADLSDDEYFALVVKYLSLKEGVSENLVRQFYSYMAASKGMRAPPLQNATLIPMHSLSDLVSTKLIDCVALTILQGANFAESTGVTMSNEEVKAQVIAKVLRSLKQDGGAPVQRVSLRQVAANFGLSEDRFIDAYRNIALFKRWVETEKNRQLIDPLMAERFAEYATQKADMQVCHMPTNLELHTLDQLLELQVYLETTTTSAQDRRDLRLPKETLSMEELEKQASELLKTRYVLDVKKISLNDLSLTIPLKKMLRWQVEDENFYAIADHFRQVQDVGALDEEARRGALDRLDEKTRREVDLFSRRQMVLQDEEFFRSAFDRVSQERVEVDFLQKGVVNLFQGVSDAQEILERLDHLASQESFTFDEEHFYQVRVLEKGEGLELLTYAEAHEKGQLTDLLDRYLKTRYPQVRILYPDRFESKKGEWIPYELAKGELKKLAFKDLFQAIEASGGYKGTSLKASDEFYLDHRYKAHLESFLTTSEFAEVNGFNHQIEKLRQEESAFAQQFLPVVDHVVLQRAEMQKGVREALSSLPLKQFAGPYLFQEGQQALVAVEEWLDADPQAISLVDLQKKISKGSEEEALNRFFALLTEKQISLPTGTQE